MLSRNQVGESPGNILCIFCFLSCPTILMDSLPPKTYLFNFRNLREAPDRNSTYLCFEVEEEQPDSPESCYWGVFRNQVQNQ